MHPLIACTIKPKTLQSYCKALEKFTATLTTSCRDLHHLDHLIDSYINKTFEEDPRATRKQEMTNLLCALYIVDARTKTGLPLSHRSIKGWEKSHNAQPPTPFTQEILHAFVMKLLLDGRAEAAVCLALSWAGYLRVSEALALRAENVALPGDPRVAAYGNEVAGIAILDAKTGPLQFVSIKDRNCITLLTCYMKKLSNIRDTLFTIKYSTYAAQLKKVMSFFNVTHLKFTTHSARIGGALHDFMRGTKAEDIALKGRWNSLTSLRHYFTTGRAWLMKMNITDHQNAKIKQYSLNMVQTTERYRSFV
ncbi:hypothetical protein BWQ96_09826 [Gracilariopsis chorda]|uniref:Tyr recombinase domain-containing protein n=1 Tax=Gracilariopsis chorda TaxID=448386 RepID=A0A2V3IH27_9FLOR|nr:hypothetical protein BWQ96_09826 [Gracilariopsis chorda]|eukprot:PXF40450.1 hypothetical protein BWQ96_09826 [Gracilariopsis chorda]